MTAIRAAMITGAVLVGLWSSGEVHANDKAYLSEVAKKAPYKGALDAIQKGQPVEPWVSDFFSGNGAIHHWHCFFFQLLYFSK